MIKVDIKIPSTADSLRAAMAEVEMRINGEAREPAARTLVPPPA